MEPARSQSQRVLDYLETRSAARTKELTALGATPATISRLVKRGQIVRISRGLYQHVDADVGEHHTIALAIRRVPHAIVCLVSALVLHDLTDLQPNRVWLAIGRKDRKPTVDWPRLKIVRFPKHLMIDQTEVKHLEGVPVRLTSITRTVVDLYRYRKTVGEDLALDALKTVIRKRRASPSEIAHIASEFRMWKHIRPHLEALTFDA